MDKGAGEAPRAGARQPEHAGPLVPVAAALGRLRARARTLLLARAVGLVGGGLLLAIVLAAAADYVLRTPDWFRGAIWVLGLAALAGAVWRLVVPAWRFRPSLTEIALRLERSDPGRSAGLSNVLASGLELVREGQAADEPRGWLAGRAVREAAERFAAFRRHARPSTILRARPALAGLLVLALGAGLALGAASAWPSLSAIGARRILAPWSGAQWPKRTAVADVTDAAVHPLGTALPLRAAITRTNQAAGETRVTARYRLIGPDGQARSRQVILNPQERAVEVATAEGVVAGELFERLIEPAALALDERAGAPAEGTLEYWFETEDDRTEPRRVKLVTPPAVAGAAARITPPEYARPTVAAPPGPAAFVSGALDLGPGNDQRALVGPVIQGSAVRLELSLNKPVPGPGGDDRAWLQSALPGVDLDESLGDSLAVRAEGDRWVLEWTARRSVRLPVVVHDEHGLTSVDESAYSFEVVEDRPPTATVTQPPEDEQVLPTASVELAGEARDDVGLVEVALERQRARPPLGSIGAPAEPVEEPARLAARPIGSDRAQASIATTLDLRPLDLRPGDEVWITTVAADTFAFQGRTHDPVRSTPRRLRIVSEEQLVEQIRGELAGLRRAAMQMDEEQADLARSVRDGAVSPDERRRQAALGQRLAQQRENLQRLQQRVERNRLRDAALEGLLADAHGLLGEAQSAAAQAAAAMDAAAAAEPDAPRAQLDDQQQERARAAQEQVRDRLGQLIRMLDRGEDGWLVRRELQRLLEQQRALQQQTADAGQATIGRAPEDLAADERARLERLAERQRELAQQAQRALDELAERATQLRQSDPAQADAMNQAAQRGREAQVPQNLEQAGRNIEQNQTTTAQEQQQAAAEALEQMLDDLEQAERGRDEALRRILASLIESIDALIAQQERELSALDLAEAAGVLAGLDAGMVRLHQNTLGVLDQSRNAGRETADLSDLLDRAARAQSSAIVALRADPADAPAARQAEQESLRLLRLARDEAQRLEREARQRDQQRQRAELRRVYRDVLEQQVALRHETAPFVGRQIGRRERVQIRGLGERQETLRTTLADLRKKTAELDDATVFDLAHRRLDMAMGAASKRLRSGNADDPVLREQDSAIRTLQALIDALAEQAERTDEFREPEGAGGGQGGGAGQDALIPPLAELRLLRALQQEAADLTRALDEDPTATPEQIDEVGTLQHALAEQGQVLIEKLSQPGGPPADPTTPE